MKKKIIVRGPVMSRSGYGYQARFALKALRSREDLFDIYIQNIPWGKTGWVWRDDEFRQWMDQRILATIEFAQRKEPFDMSLQITIPNEWERLAPVNIGYTAGIETSRVAPVWLAMLWKTQKSSSPSMGFQLILLLTSCVSLSGVRARIWRIQLGGLLRSSRMMKMLV